MASTQQNLSTTPVDGVVLRPNCSAIADLSVWHLTQTSLCSLNLRSSEASLGLSDVDLSKRAWYLVYDVRLLLDGERGFDFSKHDPTFLSMLRNLSSYQVESREPNNLSSSTELN